MYGTNRLYWWVVLPIRLGFTDLQELERCVSCRDLVGTAVGPLRLVGIDISDRCATMWS